jgi:copper resistance protein C
MRLRTIIAIPAATALLALPAIALGHAPLASSTPAAGANLDTAPTSVTLTFSGDSNGELDPDGSSFTVTDADGKALATGKVDLDVAARNVMTADVSITDPGVYTVKWTSESADGATLDGAFSFGYKATAAIPAATGGEDDDHGGSPDTSIGAAGPQPLAPLAPIGALMLLTAAGLLVRRQLAVPVR